MSMADIPKTPLLDELMEGPWPSFVREIKKAAKKSKTASGLLAQLERSYTDKISYWKHGGLVGVKGYGGGVIGRYSFLAEQIPDVAHFHTIRLNQPSGWFYTSEVLHKLCDVWEKYGSCLTNMHGSTGDLVLLGCRTEVLERIFSEVSNDIGFDLGGSGSDMRTPSCCVGPARCEWACYDTLALTYNLTMRYQSELHRPEFQYKFKIKSAGCPNDCVASVARADLSIIGTWRDAIQVNADAVGEYASKGLNIARDVVNRCPGRCMEWDGKALAIDDKSCVHCMHCINAMPKALAPGKDRGAAILLGAKAPIIEGALLSSVMIPFIKLEAPEDPADEDAYPELIEFIEKTWEFWNEHGKSRERIGELIQRVGMGTFLEEIDHEPVPEMISAPRYNPYVFYDEYYEEGEEGEEEEEE
jgi:sulfite reductase alpha subunit